MSSFLVTITIVHIINVLLFIFVRLESESFGAFASNLRTIHSPGIEVASPNAQTSDCRIEFCFGCYVVARSIHTFVFISQF